MMSSWIHLLQLLLLVSLGSASHYFGATSTFTYKGKNPDGSITVAVRSRSTFDGCLQLNWNCRSGNCGSISNSERGEIDRGTNAPVFNDRWCETEVVEKRVVPSDKPFQLSANSCCWIPKRLGGYSWALLTQIDLGWRSDTGIPNRSPDVAILPFLRVPQNCPRTYKLMSFDPDGDQVRCRYGVLTNVECHGCSQPSGFSLDTTSCTLQYNFAKTNPRVFAFELVVEDFPRKPITVSYADGSSVQRFPLFFRRKRQAPESTTPWWSTSSTTQSADTNTTSSTPWWSTSSTTQSADTSTISPPNALPIVPQRVVARLSSSISVSSVQKKSSASSATLSKLQTSSKNNLPTTSTTATPFQALLGQQKVLKAEVSAQEKRVWIPLPTPLSKLPLQFSLLVDPPVPTCHEGVYLPKLVYPTPEDGARVQAQVDKVVEIRVKAEVQYGKISDLLISGPLGVTKHRTTHDEFVIRWTPVPHNLWNHYPICFAVESETDSYTTTTKDPIYKRYHKRHVITPTSNSGIYHSEMRCVVVDVREGTVQTNVICTENTMTVEVERKSLAGLLEDHLKLNDPSDVLCSLQTHSNKTHVIGIIPLNSCGTQIEEDKDNLIFRNMITAFDHKSDLITRKHKLMVQFYCQYPKRGNVTLNFVAHRKKITVWDRGMGTFTYQFEFFTDKTYGTMIDPNSYPLVYKIGTRIFMQIEATSSVNNTVLFVETCRASPYDNLDYKHAYSIIENGCVVDPTVVIHRRSHNKMFRFSLEAFKFIGMYPQVYISCSVLMCEAGNKNTRSAQGCIRHKGHWTKREVANQREKRETAIQSQNHFVSQGPLRLSGVAEESGGSVTLNLNLVFIVGCLLAAVAMISGVVLLKNRQGTIKYHPLAVTDKPE
ncbi:unnamed protein product [Ophioblennius macclurei]